MSTLPQEAVTVERFYTQQASELQLRLVAGATGLKRIIREPTVNRPGLALAGFTKYFASKRVQVIGAAAETLTLLSRCLKCWSPPTFSVCTQRRDTP